MSIEINNQGIFNNISNPAEEGKLGRAEKNHSNHVVNTGTPTQTLQLSEMAEKLHSLEKIISSLPVKDAKRIEQVSAKLQSKSLDILQDAQKRLQGAERIADKILSAHLQE